MQIMSLYGNIFQNIGFRSESVHAYPLLATAIEFDVLLVAKKVRCTDERG